MSIISIKIDAVCCRGFAAPVNPQEGRMDRQTRQCTDAAVPAAFRQQIDWCDRLGSPFTARLLERLLRDIDDGGPAAALVAGWPGDPVADALPLRLAGALHALVLAGTAPDLASCYPPRAADGPDLLGPALRGAVTEHAGFLRGFLASPPQTNEVGRAAVLLGGFLQVAAATGLPLSLLEIGASAGLNLVWDRYRYRLGSADWGDPHSRVLLAPEWRGSLPPLDAPVIVAERAACDVAPIDLEDEAQRLRLRAYVWADQVERLARLDGAVAVARRAGHRVEAADAATWLRAKLARLPAGRATVLFHSIMWTYLSAPDRAAIAETAARAGEAATAAAPFAWLRFELQHPDAPPELRLTLWPGHGETCLARAHPHGSRVTWLGG
jgi:hypothetical protein